jgi:hypothetical protein
LVIERPRRVDPTRQPAGLQSWRLFQLFQRVLLLSTPVGNIGGAVP